MNKIEQNLIDFVYAAINDTQPPACENWDKLISLAKFNDLQNLIAEEALKSEHLPESTREMLFNMQMGAVIKDANQETEVNSVINSFEKNHIKAIMLKGWYLKRLYPRMDLRTMADTDIFIKQSAERKVHELLKLLGYSVVTFGGKKDNVYYKDPVITLEMHKNLFMYEDEWNERFNTPDSEMYIWNHIVPIDGYQYIYRMDDELFFVYMIAHTAKHLLDDGGIGARAFLDIWIYLREKPDLNFEIIFRDFDKLNLTKFAETAIALSEFWFDKKSASTDVEEFGDYILKCGVYGNSDFFVVNNEVMRDGKQHGKWGYAFKRAFPTMESMKHRYPELDKKPWLLPVCYTKRLWYSLAHRKDAIKGEINSAGKIDFEQANSIRELYQNIGL